MVQHIICTLLCALLLAGCGGTPARKTPLEELPGDYALEQAKADGCVVHEDGDVTSGQQVWDDFYGAVSAGKSASVRLGFHYTLGDPSRYDPAYYASIKDQYPVLYIQDLDFDGETFTLRWYEGGEEIIREYQYLMRYEGEAESPTALFDRYVRYVLTNDDTVTWEDIWRGLASSQFGAGIDATTVYIDLITE